MSVQSRATNWLGALLGEPVDDPGHDVGGVDLVVVAEPPDALDPVLGGGRSGEAPADGRKGSASDVGGGADEIGERFGLAQSECSGYGENPADDRVG